MERVSPMILSRHDLHGLPPLHVAAGAGDMAELTRLLAEAEIEARASTCQGTYSGHDAQRDLTPLMVAAGCELGSTEAVRALLDHGADPRARSAAGVDALWYAAGSGDAKRVAVLLAAGGQPLGVAGDGRSAVAVAARAGGTEAVRLLLQAGASAHPPPTEREVSAPSCEVVPLFAAAASGQAECVTVLLEAGAVGAHRDREGQTALMFATSPEVVSRLLAAGCPCDARNVHGHGALEAVLLNQRIALSAAMRDDPDCGDMRVLVPAAQRRQAAVVAALLDAGAGTEARDAQGQTALLSYCDCYHACASLVRLLLARGARVQARGPEGGTALHAVARNRGRPPEADDVVRLLVEAGLPVDIRDDRGRTPLHLAAGTGPANRAAIPVLLHGGADVEARDGDGRTPLMLAAAIEYNSYPIIRLLLSNGAGPNARGPDGRRPRDTVVDRVAVLEAQLVAPLPDDPAQAAAEAAQRRLTLRMAHVSLRALSGPEDDPPAAEAPPALPEPIWLGYRRRRRRAPPPPWPVEVEHIEEVCNYGHACWADGANRSTCYPTADDVPDGCEDGDDGGPGEVYAYRAIPLSFGASGTPQPLTSDDLVGADEPPPEAPDLSRYTRLGYDVTECLAAGSYTWPGCSPLSPYCNGMYFGLSALVNRHCLIDDLTTAQDIAIHFGVCPPEPGPYVIVEVWRAAPPKR